MLREQHHVDTVVAVLRDADLRRSCLETLFTVLQRMTERKPPLPYSERRFQSMLENHYGLIASARSDAKQPEESADAQTVIVTVPSYAFHPVVKRIRFSSTPPPSHENDLDSIAYCCLRLVLAPLIEVGVFRALGRGYHQYLVAYNQERLTRTEPEVLAATFPSTDRLIRLLEAAADINDDETREVIDILRESRGLGPTTPKR